MNNFIKKPIVVEAITFEQLVEYGKKNGGNIIDNMPWSFEYNGHAVSHENNDCYLVPTVKGISKFNRGDMLITGIDGEIYPCKKHIFDASYSKVSNVERDTKEISGEKFILCNDPVCEGKRIADELEKVIGEKSGTYQLIIEDKNGNILSISPFYCEQTLCYAIDNEVNLEIHNFHVVEDATAQFAEIDGYWKKV